MKKIMAGLVILGMLSCPLLAKSKMETAQELFIGACYMTVGIIGIDIATGYSIGTGVYFLIKAGVKVFNAGRESE